MFRQSSPWMASHGLGLNPQISNVNTQTIFLKIQALTMKIRWSWNSRIFIIVLHIPVIRHIHIESLLRPVYIISQTKTCIWPCLAHTTPSLALCFLALFCLLWAQRKQPRLEQNKLKMQRIPRSLYFTILQMPFWNLFSWTKLVLVGLKFHWSLFPRLLLKLNEHGSDNGLELNKR